MLFGVARAFATPASRALPIDWASEEVVERVVALKSVAFQAGIIAGPAAFGFIFVAGRSIPYLAAVCAYVLVALLLLTIRSIPIKRLETSGTRQAFRDALEGLRFVRSKPVLFGAISLDLIAVLLGGAVALLPAIAEDRLGVGAVGLGLVACRCGYRRYRRGSKPFNSPSADTYRPLIICFSWDFGVGTIVLGLTTNFTLAFLALMVLAGADAVSVYIR